MRTFRSADSCGSRESLTQYGRVAVHSPESPTRISIDLRRVPGIRRLAADYAYDFHGLAPFFSGNPTDRAAWTQAIARSQAHARRRKEIAAVIADQQERRGAPPRAIEAGRLLADNRTVAILTGQQAGLFGGPLYTLLKAITAIKLAEQISREHQVPAVAIFWIDAEDHDWEEVRSCTVLDAEFQPRSVTLADLEGAGMSLETIFGYAAGQGRMSAA